MEGKVGLGRTRRTRCGLRDVRVEPDEVVVLVSDKVEGVPGPAADHTNAPRELKADLRERSSRNRPHVKSRTAKLRA